MSTCKFGTRWKRKDILTTKEDYYSIMNEALQWVWTDHDGFTHGRIRITTSLGRLNQGPGPGQYNLNDGPAIKSTTMRPKTVDFSDLESNDHFRASRTFRILRSAMK